MGTQEHQFRVGGMGISFVAVFFFSPVLAVGIWKEDS